MSIDLDRHLYTNSELHRGLDDMPIGTRALVESIVDGVLAAPVRVTRVTTHLQGPLEFLGAPAELRLHLWVELPQRHPRFPTADRGLVVLVQAIDAHGLVGGARAQVSWLGAPLPEDHPGLASADWILQMEAEQGYRDLPGSEWGRSLAPHRTAQVLSWVLAHHLATCGPRASLVLAGQVPRRRALYEE